MTRTLALITGASSGIGAAYAQALAADHDLVLVARRADRLSEAAEKLRAAGAAVEVLPADLGTLGGVSIVADRLAAGDVRLLVNNAGAGGYAPLGDVEPSEVDRLLRLNGTAPIELARAALPGMLAAGAGTIVNVASLLAFSAGLELRRPEAAEAGSRPKPPARTLYAASKAGIVAFSRLLAAELADTGVRVQVVCPGIVATEFNGGRGQTIPSAMSAEGVVQASLAGLRLGEAVCVPGLEDQVAALDALAAAEGALLAGSTRPEPASRYREAA
ncbi:SDR family NAD(P)-dependent oxidoreductase [Glycomyces algeriensis]|uniref:Short-chain dehydrogenase n=1 Tax=Glycomyces algeriensis TaxID=256037 RepID=A0A9W6GBV7_9ACTN|nr:SDR family NAD(P)-dependent oxidoreductase [Glycomyces algeriensis]MDA1365631.1 SDR family NAD(P)-dependent oxidoreductase [Glycomyces algeriensis]MDR7351319.1 short-subunit dehydrogenase [Glycomyces algeriensis]GLI44035.1 short-chain dehydrogenase [Glycomyces algeriensis]